MQPLTSPPHTRTGISPNTHARTHSLTVSPATHLAARPQKRAKAFASYKDYLGKDITSLVILPVWIMQPFTMLQNMAEITENTQLLDKAARTEDPYER